MYGHAVIRATMLAMIYLLLMMALPACNACSEDHWIPQHVNYMATTPALDNVYDNLHGNFNALYFPDKYSGKSGEQN